MDHGMNQSWDESILRIDWVGSTGDWLGILRDDTLTLSSHGETTPLRMGHHMAPAPSPATEKRQNFHESWGEFSWLIRSIRWACFSESPRSAGIITMVPCQIGLIDKTSAVFRAHPDDICIVHWSNPNRWWVKPAVFTHLPSLNPFYHLVSLMFKRIGLAKSSKSPKKKRPNASPFWAFRPTISTNISME